MVTFSQIKNNTILNYEGFGIKLEFEITAEIVDLISEVQLKQQKQMFSKLKKHLKLDSNVKNEDISKQIYEKAIKEMDEEDLFNMSEGNPFENIVYKIHDLDELTVKKHFEQYGSLASKRYSQFIDELAQLIVNKINEKKTEKDQKTPR